MKKMMKIFGVISVFLLVFQCVFGVEHPHLLFGSEDLPRLKEKIKSGIPKLAYDQMLQRCEKHLQIKDLKQARSTTQNNDAVLDPLCELALAWQFSRDDRYKRKVTDLLEFCHNQKLDLHQMRYDTALLFDWSYEFLNETERAYLKNIIVKDIRENPKYQRFPYFMINSNWGFFMFAPLMVRSAAVLRGHPEYDQKIVERLANQMQQLYTCWIDDDGCPAEHGAYLNYPMEINGAVATAILQRMGYDLVSKTNLYKIPQWQVLETTPVAPSRYYPMEDCNLQRPSLFLQRFLLAMSPDDKLTNLIASRVGVENDLNPDPISGIIWHKTPVKVTDNYLPEANSVKFFKARNILHYKSDWTESAFCLATQAGINQGHSHSDVGSFMLWGYGKFWVIDPGYGIKDAEDHNVIVIDGHGPSSVGGEGIVNQCLISNFAVTISIDSKVRWNTKSQYEIRQQMTPTVTDAERVITVMCPDKDLKVPPYLLIYDYLRRDDQVHKYTWLLQQDKYNTFEHLQGRSVIKCPTETSFMIGPKEKTSTAFVNQKIDIPTDGKYYLYVLGSGKTALTISLDGKRIGDAWLNSGQSWNWDWFCISGKKALELKAGSYQVKIEGVSESLKLKYLIYSPLELAELKGISHPKQLQQGGGVELGPNATFSKDWSYFKTVGSEPELNVSFLSPADHLNLSDDIRIDESKEGRNWHRWNRRLNAEISANEGLFTVLLYPREGGMPQLHLESFNRYGLTHRIDWPNATDFLAYGTPKPTEAKQRKAELILIRLPKEEALSEKLSENMKYMIVNGDSLKIGGTCVFTAETAVDDRLPITHSRSCMLAAVICSGENLIIDLIVEPGSRGVPRLVEFKAFGPKVKKVICNGQEIPFKKQDAYIVAYGRARMVESPLDWNKQCMERFFKNLETKVLTK